MPPDQRVVVVGATGAVGLEALRILADLGLHSSRVAALASPRSAGTSVPFGTGCIPVHNAETFDWLGTGLALLCADAHTARRLAPVALRVGATVVDNSSAFRLDPAVPLVVPEINGHLLEDHPRLVANPNCSTIILLVALEPLRRACGVSAISVATYQAVSGAGLAGLDALHAETLAAASGLPPARAPDSPFAEPCAFNVFSHDSPIGPDGLNGEERKMIDESRRIWDRPDLPVSPTCVRVPVARAHTQAITVQLSRDASEEQVRAALARAPGVRVLDDRAGNRFPTPLHATGADEVLVGRIRPDPATARDAAGRCRRWCLLASADQLRKGAALNAVQIGRALRLIPGIGGPGGPARGRTGLTMAVE
jgi:aspartate-semialdehyde dehydrogenase